MRGGDKEEENLLGFVEDEEMKGKFGSNCQDREREREGEREREREIIERELF